MLATGRKADALRGGWCRGLVPGLALLLAGGCAARQYPLPMTAAQLAAHGEDAALAAYLGQPDAGPEVCDPAGPAPRVGVVDRGLWRTLDEAFLAGRVPPGRWRACVGLLLRGAPPAEAWGLLTDALRAGQALLGDDRLETDAGVQARLEAVVQVYLERPPGRSADPEALERLVAQAERGLARPSLGPAGARLAGQLLSGIALERGLWGGAPVDAAALQALHAAGDEAALRRLAAGLPDAALRDSARRLVVRLHLHASPDPEVRQGGGEIEEQVVRMGANPIALDHHPPLRAWIDRAGVPTRHVEVEQQVERQAARLLAVAGDPPVRDVLPAVPLRGALQVQVAGLARPVTACAPPEALEVAPCLAAADLRPVGGPARLDADGSLRLEDTLREDAVVALAGQERLAAGVAVGGLEVGVLDWPLRYASPGPLVLEGRGPGGSGPALEVRVEGRGPGRLVFTISSSQGTWQAVVEPEDLAAFRVVTRGGRGAGGWSGADGQDGRDGEAGSDASCPGSPGQSGTPGGDGGGGGAGQAGGAGGPGGDVRVVVDVAPALREATLAALRTTFLSQGGPGGGGGGGGRGGHGGRGGRGGWGTSCFDAEGRSTSLPGGWDGHGGHDGLDGPAGPDGPPGAPGRVTFVVGP